MASWRDSVSAQVQQDLDDLVDAGLSTAEHELTERGAFIPFGVVRTVDGQTQVVGVGGESEQPDAYDLIRRLWEALEEHRDEFRAAGVVSDRTRDAGDAVGVELEHADGQALVVSLPYRLADGRFEPGELSAGVGTSRIW